MSYKNEVLASLPLAYWRLDESGQEITALDAGGGGLNGSYVGGLALGQAALVDDGNSVAFGGVDGYIGLPDLGLSSQALSVELWINVTWAASKYNPLFLWDSNGNSRVQLFDYSQEGLSFSITQNGVSVTVKALNLSSQITYHVVVVYDGSSGLMGLYLNGKLEVSSSSAPTFTSWPQTTALLASTPTFYDGGRNTLSGSMDEPAIYPRALTENEIRRHYWAGKGKTGYELEVLASGPVGYWRMDETTDTTASDEAGVHDGSIEGTVTLGQAPLAGESGSSVQLHGVDGEVILIPHSADLSFTTEFTLELWVNTSSTAARSTLLSKEQIGKNYPTFALFMESGLLNFYLGSQNGTTNRLKLTTDTAYNDGQTHHIVATLVDGMATIYVDAVPVKTGTFGFSLWASTDAVGIGGSPAIPGLGSQSFTGFLDEPALYPRALTPTEIRRHYYRGKGEIGYKLEVLSSGPEGYWRMDELSGGFVTDYSGNSRNGVYKNGVTLGSNGLIKDSPSAATFDGVDDSVEGSSLGPLSLPLTLESWARPDATVNEAVVLMTHDDPSNYFGAKIQTNSSGVLEVLLGDGGHGSSGRKSFRTTTNPLVPGEVYHLVAVIRGFSDADIYINGVKASYHTSGTASSLNTSSGIFRIGLNPISASYFNGVLAEAAVYKVALTPEEILRHYAIGKYGAATALYRLAGLITSEGSAYEALVRAFRWDTGELLGEDTSDPGDGSYEIKGLKYDGKVLVVTQPGTGLRPLAHGPVTPEQQS